MNTEHIEFQKRVSKFFIARHIGDILQLKPASLNRHYIKFRLHRAVWFQVLYDTIEVDSVDFEKRTISGFINNSATLQLSKDVKA